MKLNSTTTNGRIIVGDSVKLEYGKRIDGREHDQLRKFAFQRDYTTMADGSALVSFGNTKVLCTASIAEGVPSWLKNRGEGWVTAEYSMLPGSTPQRNSRRAGGRVKEIQRMIGRSLRAVVDLKLLGERQVIVDCDVLQADGGTRTASVCGGFLALHDALTRLTTQSTQSTTRLTTQSAQSAQECERDFNLHNFPILDECAAVSVGIVNGVPMIDLPYAEDSIAEVDLNVVMTGTGNIVEVQGTAERAPFSKSQLDHLIDLASQGIEEIIHTQRTILAEPPFVEQFKTC